MQIDKKAIRVVIGEKQALFRQGLKMLLSREPDIEIVGEAADLEETLRQLESVRPDVLMLDLALIERQGPAATFTIRQMHPSIALLFLTGEDRPEKLTDAVNAGAHGYMLKNSTPAQFVAAVREVANGTTGLNPNSLSRLAADLQALARSSQRHSHPTTLTSREQEVLKLLAEGHRVREAASLLLLSVKTVEAHKLNLMRKLDIHNRNALIAYASKHGLVEAPEKS